MKKKNSDINSLRQLLAELPSTLYKEDKKPIIFVIDELDRCRPTASVDLIESIKHIFSTDGYHFIMSMNRNSIEKSLSHMYGNIDTRTYLDKFISTWINMDNLITKQSLNRVSYANEYWSKIGGEESTGVTFLNTFLNKKTISLRKIKKILSTYAIALNSKDDKRFFHYEFVMILCIAKCIDIKAYNDIISGDLNSKYVSALFDSDEMNKLISLFKASNVHGIFQSIAFKFDLGRDKILPYLADAYVENLGSDPH